MVITSCKRNGSIIYSPSCKPNTPDYHSHVNIGKDTIETDIWMTEKNPAYHYADNCISASAHLLKSIKRTIKLDENLNGSQDVALVLYLDKHILKNNETINTDCLLGYSYYYIFQDTMVFQLYLKNTHGTYAPVKELETPVSVVSTGHVHCAAELFPEKYKKMTALLITNNQMLDYNRIIKQSEILCDKLKDYVNQKG